MPLVRRSGVLRRCSWSWCSFFILAMVTAYAGRNLIFEQRTSINNQRATQAFEMAEAGLEFAVGLLSGGRVDDRCQPTASTAEVTFRQRHFANVDGTFTFSPAQANLRPTCMMLAGGPSCSCPGAGRTDSGRTGRLGTHDPTALRACRTARSRAGDVSRLQQHRHTVLCRFDQRPSRCGCRGLGAAWPELRSGDAAHRCHHGTWQRQPQRRPLSP